MDSPEKRKMTQAQFTRKTRALAEELRSLIKEAGYPSGYLTVVVLEGRVMFNNEYWGKDKGFSVNFTC